MRIACCQFDIVWENKSANHAKVRAMLEAAKLPRGSLALLPEMFATGFSMNIAGISDSIPGGETERFLSRTASELGLFLLGGIVTSNGDGRGRNETLLYNPEGVQIARYQKIHPFTLSGETQYYAGGNEIVAVAVGEFTVAPFICYDLRFPEIFRKAVSRGAQLYTVIANWPFPRDEHWVTLLRARAIENQAYVAGVNRSGTDPKYNFPGRSMIVDPQGNILSDAGPNECVISVDVNVKTVLDWRRDFPALKDRKET